MFRKTPGSSSAKTPSLASARRTRCSASASTPDVARELCDRPWAVGERVGDPQIGDDRERLRHHRPAEEVPENRIRLALAHVRAPCDCRRDLVHLRVGERAAVEERPSVADDRDHGRLAESKRLRELLLDRARSARKLRERKRAAADTRDGVLDLAADERGEPLGPGADDLDRLVEHAQHGHVVARRRIESERERPLECGQRELVRAQRALKRMSAQPLDEFRPTDDDPGLRPAEELVAREADEIGACAQALGRCRLVADARRARPSRDRRRAGARGAARRPRARRAAAAPRSRRRGSSTGARGGARPSPGRSPLVVGRARAIRRPDLDEPRAGARENVRDAEAVADLDQLAARHDDLAVLGERREREEHRGGVVVDDERRPRRR